MQDVVTGRLSLIRLEVAELVSVGEGRELALNPIRLQVSEPVSVQDLGPLLVGARLPVPRIRGMFAWEHWLRRNE